MAAKTFEMTHTETGQPKIEISLSNKLPDTQKDKKKKQTENER